MSLTPHQRKALEDKTNEIAAKKGCDRAVFSVCWGEVEQGLKCKCKQEARLALREPT